MTKTRRHQTAREARQAAVASVRAAAWNSREAALSLITNHDWKQITTALDGLLCIEFLSPFTDLTCLCPEEAWLVVDLACVRINGGGVKGLRQGVIRAVDALTRLCRQAEALRPWKTLYLTFWTHVFSSDMYQTLVKGNESWIHDGICCMSAKGTIVALRWRGREVNSDYVIAPLRRFLEATTGSHDSRHTPIRVALQIEECELTKARLEQLHEILKVERQNARSLLCSHTSLCYLSLRGNALYPHHLETLIALLEDPHTLRIDGLNLGDTIPHDGILPEGFVDLFQRTLATALQQKSSTAHDKGLYLSFERSKHLDFYLVQSMERALLDATRPVRGLSLEDVTPLDGDAWVRLIRLLNTPLPTATSDFELSLTSFKYDQEAYNEVQESLFRSLTEMVSESIPSLYAAGMSGVTARLHKEEIYQDESLAAPMRDVQVSTTEYCDVVCVSPNGHFQLHVSDRNAQDRRFTGWAESKSIAGARIGNRDIVGSSCTRLIVDMDEERPSYCDFLMNNDLGHCDPIREAENGR